MFVLSSYDVNLNIYACMCTADFINKNKSLSSMYFGAFNINHFVALL